MIQIPMIRIPENLRHAVIAGHNDKTATCLSIKYIIALRLLRLILTLCSIRNSCELLALHELLGFLQSLLAGYLLGVDSKANGYTE